MDNRFHNFFLLRRPLLSLNVLFDFNRSIQRDPAKFNQQILDLFKQEQLQQAIYLSSPDLYHSLIRILDGSFPGEINGICKSLYRYLIRMCSRSTPFGTMAGICCGEISSQPTSISFTKPTDMQAKMQLSFPAFESLCKALATRSDVITHLDLCCNTSLYRFQNVHRYIKRSGKNNETFTQLEVESNPFLDLVIHLTKTPVSYQIILNELTKAGLSIPESESFIESLHDEQLLSSEIEASPISENGLDKLIVRFDLIANKKEIASDLSSIKEIVCLGGCLRTASEKIRAILGKYYTVEPDEQVLLVNSVLAEDSCNIKQSTISIIQKEIDELMVLSSETHNYDLKGFCDAFFRKYQTRLVPLLEALDPQTGIGYGRKAFTDPHEFEHIQNLTLGAAKIHSSAGDRLDGLRLDLYEKAISQQKNLASLTKTELAKFDHKKKQTADGTYLMGNLLTRSQTDLDKNVFQFNLNAMGSASAFNLMSRFCTIDPVLKGLVTQSISCEELLDTNIMYVEINHLPGNKEGNILNRPHLRKYELSYLAASKAEPENQILPEDILVSVPDGKQIILWSKKHNIRIYPRLTSAHNYTDGLPVYRFLCDLCKESSAAVFNWSWGMLSERDFLPRIQYKHLIVCKAQWNLTLDMLTDGGRNNPTEKNLEHLMKSMRIPRYTQIADNDQLLLTDLDNPLSLEMLLATIKKTSHVKLTEFFESPEQGLIRIKDQTYSHEMIIPFKGSASKVESTSITINQASENRFYAAGSEWIYFKVYLPQALADYTLLRKIKPFCDGLLQKGLLKKWFFVRYYDPDHHLRIRLFVPGSNQIVFEVISLFCDHLQCLMNETEIDKFTIDTYERELERYSVTSYQLTETLFYKDSIAVCNLLELIGESTFFQKWHVALRAIDTYLNALNYDPDTKRSLVNQIHGSFHIEFDGRKEHIYEMDKNYRLHFQDIKTLLENDPQNECIRQIDCYLQPIVDQCRKIVKNIADAQNMTGYISGIIHMFLNRIFSTEHRKLEFVVYH